jgi:hypothetical protein
MGRIRTTRPTILRYRGNVFTELLRSNDKGIHRYTPESHTKRRVQQFFYCLRVFDAAGTCLLSRCLATIGDTHIDTDSWERFTKCAVEVGSDAMIYIRNFIKISSGFHKFTGGIHRHTDSMVISKTYLHFLKI